MSLPREAIELLPYPLAFVAFAAIGLAFVDCRGKSAKINFLLVLTIIAYTAAISLLWLNSRFLIYVGMLLTIYASYGLVRVTRPGVFRLSVIGVVLGFIAWGGGIKNMVTTPVSEFNQGRSELDQELRSAGMGEAAEVLSFSFELYDIQSPSKELFMTPWFGDNADVAHINESFKPYASVDDIAERMDRDHQRFLVYDNNAPKNVRGLDTIWPLPTAELRAHFDLISVQRGIWLWKLRN
jgi:hypothetical protein